MNEVLPSLYHRSDRNPTDVPISWWEKVLYFYQAPIVRFCYHVVRTGEVDIGVA